jgi:ribonuclease R
VIEPLYGAYEALERARGKRGTLDLAIPERQVRLDPDGTVREITTRPRYDSHRLIEEFMIAANVAAAETLEARRQPCIYRIHDRPDPEKLDAVREFLATLGFNLAKGQVIKPASFTQILERAAGTPEEHLVSQVILRSQAQAVYSPENIGHFGLALRRYAHFTSPIRRYADLIVHRSLVRALGLGGGALVDAEIGKLERIAEYISGTERRAAQAERDAVDRYTAAFLAAKVGSVFSGRIGGVTRFGLFVTLDESGADGLVPISTLPDDFYVHDEHAHALVGRRWGRTYRLAATVMVRLLEADPLTGSTVLALIDGEGDTGDAVGDEARGRVRRVAARPSKRGKNSGISESRRQKTGPRAHRR